MTEDRVKRLDAIEASLSQISDELTAHAQHEARKLVSEASASVAYLREQFAAPSPTEPKVLSDVERAIKRLGAMPEGHCYCSKDRIGDDSKVHEPECADIRAALNRNSGGDKVTEAAEHHARAFHIRSLDARCDHERAACNDASGTIRRIAALSTPEQKD